MDYTTIAIKKSTKASIMEFGNKSETFNEIIERLIKSARERQLHDILMDDKDTVSVDEALSKAKKRWQ